MKRLNAMNLYMDGNHTGTATDIQIGIDLASKPDYTAKILVHQYGGTLCFTCRCCLCSALSCCIYFYRDFTVCRSFKDSNNHRMDSMKKSLILRDFILSCFFFHPSDHTVIEFFLRISRFNIKSTFFKLKIKFIQCFSNIICFLFI